MQSRLEIIVFCSLKRCETCGKKCPSTYQIHTQMGNELQPET